MLKHFHHLYTDRIRREALRRFALTLVSPETLPDASHSYVYECQRPAKRYILKITHSIHRKPSDILGELEFINYLSDNGVQAPPALRSLNGNLVETIPAACEDDGQFVAAAYEKAPGSLMDWRDWTPAIYEQWGALIGRMHALAKDYRPSHQSTRRRFWHQDGDWNMDDPIYLDRPEFRQKARAVKEWLLTLPTGRDDFGLIHSDLHQWNFFHHAAGCQDASILPFDFDNAHYDWFLSDFTTVIINVVTCQQYHYARREYDYWTQGKPMDAPTFLDYFMTPFIEGYNRHNRLAPIWMRLLPRFLNRHWLTFYCDALRDPNFALLPPDAQAANFPWRTLAQTEAEVMNDYWSRFNFQKYA